MSKQARKKEKINELLRRILSKKINPDYQRRDEIILGEASERSGWVFHRKFQGLTIEKLEQLLAEDFAALEDFVGESPTIQEFYEFAKKCAKKGFNTQFMGFVTYLTYNYRVYIDGFEVADLELTEDIVGSFRQLTEKASYVYTTDIQLYAWWKEDESFDMDRTVMVIPHHQEYQE